MQLIDTHCHLDFPVLRDNIDDVLFRARQQGVQQFVVPGVQRSNWQSVLELCGASSGLYPALGLHPCFLQQDHADDLELLESLLRQHPELVAVGEIGLDLFIPDADLEHQLEILVPQLELAKQFNKPVLLHVRKAHDQMLRQLRRLKLPRGGFVHAFSGSEQQAKIYLDLGFKLGIGGSVTYERARKLRQLVSDLPLDSFVLETDSPDMPLSGYQGETNYPERVRIVVEALAGLREESAADIAAVTSATAAKILGLQNSLSS
ncbi:MAG: TatD family hydrolase [Amphritea sp.]|nr:TatD family hydrolase [Amphritea sp.]